MGKLQNFDGNITVPCTIAMSSVLFMAISKYFLKNSNKNGSYCPIAPSSYLQSIKGMSGKDMIWFIMEMFQKTKSNTYFLRLPIPGGGVYIVGDIPTIRAIFQDPKSDKAADMYKPFENTVGYPNVFSRSSTHPVMKSVRKCVSKAFSAKDITRMNSLCDKNIKAWIKNDLETFITEGSTFDPSKEMVNLTFDVIMESAFEYSCSSSTRAEREFFFDNLEKCLVEFGMKQISNPFRKFLLPFLKERRDAFQAGDECRKFTQKVLDNYRANINKSKENTIIKLILNNEDLKSDKERIAEILTMMIAGFETTGYTISSTLILLAKHPRVAKKLQKELMNMNPTDWSKSPYLRCVIQESKRLAPVAAIGSARTIAQEFIVKNDSNKPNITIPKGATCIIPFIIPFRDEAIFKNPEAFYPERWEKENVTKEMDDSKIFFGAGNRNCIGQGLAMAELYSTIPQLVAGYNLEIETEGKLEYFLTMKYNGCQLRVTKAEY